MLQVKQAKCSVIRRRNENGWHSMPFLILPPDFIILLQRETWVWKLTKPFSGNPLGFTNVT